MTDPELSTLAREFLDGTRELTAEETQQIRHAAMLRFQHEIPNPLKVCFEAEDLTQ